MTRIIKVGGRPQLDPMLPSVLASAARSAEALVIVHGGGDDVTRLQHAFGYEAQFSNGRRITKREDIDLVRMALSGTANKRLVASLVQHGLRAVGLSGEDAALIEAAPVDAGLLGHVGRPTGVNVDLLMHLIEGGYLPVVSPVSCDAGGVLGTTLNVNGDDVAAALATALGASELLLVSDVPGVLDGTSVVPCLTPSDLADLVAAGVVRGGMLAKLEAAAAAVEHGVSRVRIADVAGIADGSRGTIIEATRELV